jgi:hypothetical protein
MKTNFSLQKYHNYSLTELEAMMPWERKILITQVTMWLEEEKRKLERKKHGG